MKFSQNLGDTQAQTIKKIQEAFGDDAMGKTQIKEWYNQFKDDRTSEDSEPRCGRPLTSRNEKIIAKVRGKVYGDCCVTIEEIIAKVGISHGSVQSIITGDLCMRWMSAKFIEKLLSDHGKKTERKSPRTCWSMLSKIKTS
ncbi:protein GVQW3-like [Octopus sinensis]|uniref:Protein GVQW3-like n=1 Tax=Octopus sinensis TaxID=2607531 RepID=A0A6P7TMY9_9MOLL|nr:protein GVQW3-like [Octopus sinensis]